MPRRARIHFVSLHSSLVNLPISIYGPLLERSVRPQNLAVHIKLVPEPQSATDVVEAYVGWTGMASSSSLAHFNSSRLEERGLETIEIDPQYAQGLGLSQGDVVEIGLLHDLPFAHSVATEPLTSDDWEIIEIHASHVESTLLSQVRVVKTGQEIDVWVLGRTRVCLRIVSVNPKVKGDISLLTTNTEISIAPKYNRAHQSIVKDTIPVAEDQNGLQGTKTINAQVLRVLPPHITSLHFPGHQERELLAFISPSMFSLFYSLHKSTDTAYLKATYTRLIPPVDPSSSTVSPSTPVPRILDPAVSEKDKVQGGNEQNIMNDLLVGQMVGIPENHIIFPVAPNGVEGWDLIRLSLTIDQSPVYIKPVVTDITSPPSTPINTLAGVDEILERCADFCFHTFIAHAATNVVHGVPGILITGRSGSGKTSIVRTVARSIQEDSRTLTYTHFVDVSQYSERPVTAVKALLKYWLDKATWHRPSILILDNLDKLLSPELEHADSFRARNLTEIFLSIYSSYIRTATRNTRGIMLFATASSTTTLHPLINTAHIFQDVINLKPPNKDARKEMITSIIKDRLDAAQDIRQDPEAPLNYTALATQTEGYSVMDLKDLIGRAIHQVAMRASKDTTPVTLTPADFTAAQADFVPLSLRDVKLQKSDVAWSDIGGLYETRKVLRETLEWPTKYGPIFAQSPLRLRSGLLLYGFPGCGKTLLASAVAKECGLNFISVKGPELLNKYIGASEKSVRDLFERASSAKPCVLFFDEFDSIAPKRGHDSTGVTDRVVNQMLTQMDGAEGLDGVYVLAATSRPDLIDSALLRPGRLDKSLFCGMPDYEEREDILRAVRKKVLVSTSIDFGKLAAATEGYSGADLQALIYNAHLEAVHDSITSTSENQAILRNDEETIEYTSFGGTQGSDVTTKAEKMALETKLRQIKSASRPTRNTAQTPTAPTNHPITEAHIQRALKSMRPSVSLEERNRLDRIYREFLSDRSGELPRPPSPGGVGNRVSLM